MPVENNFQHDELSRKNPGNRLGVTEVTTVAKAESPAWYEAMAQWGSLLVEAGVRALVFLHGSLHGTDVFGAQRLDEAGGDKRGYSRGISGLDALLSLMREGENGIPPLPENRRPPFVNDGATQAWLDKEVGDAGNFTNDYVALACRALNRQGRRPLHCSRVVWRSEHHHLGRAVAAVELLDWLQSFCERHHLGLGDRIMVQAHGQGGLVLALVSNLLCPSSITGRPRLLEIVAEYAVRSQQPRLAVAVERLTRLLDRGVVLNNVLLDVVTLGTPVRYGWDPSGIGKLLHIVNHRHLRIDGKRWLAKMELPQITIEMPVAWGGDYVQELAVAGSDALPTTEEAREANRAVWELVEPYDGFERWLECARRAVRCPSEGGCLLVDYKDCTGSSHVQDHYYGHAVYTRREVMLFNTAEIVRRLYGVSVERGAPLAEKP
ncbi:MAG: hypothetical protein NNA18_01270 [Nitrospira sp.]|nr:hypothetical protein [Nitrospira sp.]